MGTCNFSEYQSNGTSSATGSIQGFELFATASERSEFYESQGGKCILKRATADLKIISFAARLYGCRVQKTKFLFTAIIVLSRSIAVPIQGRRTVDNWQIMFNIT